MESNELWNLVSMAIQGLAPVLLAILSWLGVMASKWIQEKVKNETASGILLRLDDAVLTVVRELQQTMVDDLKAASSDGKLTKEERDEIKTKALGNLKSYYGTKGLKILAQVLGLSIGAEFDKFLSSKLEAKVKESK